jgi:flagellar motor switch protein FliG
MQSLTLEQLTPAAAQIILEQLPDRIRQAIIDRAAKIEYPVEAIIEMAIAGYLDSEAIGFVDCKPDRGNSILFDND